MNLCAGVFFTGFLFVTCYAQSFCDNHDANGVSCFNQPADCTDVNDCEMTMVVEVPDNDTLSFTLTGKSDGWIAVGISGDQLMGADDVMMCLQNGGQVDLLDRFNVGNGKANRASSSRILGTYLTLTESSFSNGIISCTFRRWKEVNGSVGPETFSLTNSSRYMLIGRGPASGDQPMQHIRNPWISNAPVNLARGDQIETDSSDSPSMRVTDKTPTQEPKMTTAASSRAIYLSRILLAVTITFGVLSFSITEHLMIDH